MVCFLFIGLQLFVKFHRLNVKERVLKSKNLVYKLNQKINT